MLRHVVLFAVVPMAIVVSSCSLNTAEPATYVTDVSATLNGLVTSNEQPGEVTYWFNYGTTTDYGTTTPDRTIQIPAGAEDDVKYPVSEPISGLEPNTTYHYQACSSPGIDPGSRGCTNLDQTFTTGPAGSGRSGIAFSSSRDNSDFFDLYRMDSDGGNETRVTNREEVLIEPTWSADSSRLAFAIQVGVSDDIYTVDADGTNLTNLTNDGSYEQDPAWSPDGTKIAFSTQRDGTPEIYVMDADGSNPTRLTNNDFFDGQPAWSPDGSRIAFTSTGTDDASAEIYVMSASGGAPRQLTTGPLGDSEPIWSPDGTKIAFVSDPGVGSEVWSMKSDGSNETALSSDGSDPTWSPDGTRLAYFTNSSGNNDVWAMNADGSDKVQLTDAPGDDRFPTWSPRP